MSYWKYRGIVATRAADTYRKGANPLKAIKILLSVAVVIVVIGFGVYHFGTKFVADEVMSQVAAELDANGQLETIKQEVRK